jgi:drug/metabolite transporter (DMT)-like permease
MLIGILAGLTTCALWGLTFIAPRAIDPFTTPDLILTRYVVFGLTSLVLMIDPRFRPGRMRPQRLVIGIALGAVGYVAYLVSASYAVHFAGAVLPPLIIGLMPVILAVIGNWRERAVPWRTLALPLAVILIGLSVVNVHALAHAEPVARQNTLLGIFCALAALLVWVVYGMVNAEVMRAPDAPDGVRWTGLQGIGAAVGSFVLLPFVSFPISEATGPELWRFAFWAGVMGFIGAWVATWCWMVASRRLPLALSAQLIIAETVFGLGFGLAFEQRWPSTAEFIGTGLQFAGVMMAIAIFSRRRARA